MSDLDAMKASLEAARVAFVAATAQMNDAKSQYEAAKTRLETESDKQSQRIGELEKQLDQCGKEKKALLQDGKDSGNKPGPGQRVGNSKVFMDVDINGRRAGRIVIELFKDIGPLSVENFRALCTGEKGVARNGHPLHYKGSVLRHWPESARIDGDISAGESIYGEKFIANENFDRQHRSRGDIEMFTSGMGLSHGCSFCICLRNLDKTNEGNVIGRVVEGMNVVREMEKAGTGDTGNLVIADCGELP